MQVANGTKKMLTTSCRREIDIFFHPGAGVGTWVRGKVRGQQVPTNRAMIFGLCGRDSWQRMHTQPRVASINDFSSTKLFLFKLSVFCGLFRTLQILQSENWAGITIYVNHLQLFSYHISVVGLVFNRWVCECESFSNGNAFYLQNIFRHQKNNHTFFLIAWMSEATTSFR